MLERYYSFCQRFCDADKYEPEMDADSLYLALSERNLEDLILPEKRDEWNAMRSRDFADTFTADATDNLYPECVETHKETQWEGTRSLQGRV